MFVKRFGRSEGGLLLSVLFLLATFLPGGVYASPRASGQVVAPEVSARAAIVVEYPSGRILYQKTAHDRLAPASTTKILTAILALEYGKLDEVVTIAPEDIIGGSTMGLRAGEKQTLRNLLYGLLLPSGNDAGLAIARHIGSKPGATSAKEAVETFVGMMNKRAVQIGLKNTQFVNPHGLGGRDRHYSSAYDLAILTWHALHFSTFNEIVRKAEYEVPGHKLVNINKMLQRYAGADGVKTGYTRRAGLCLVTSATRGGKRLISVVLNAPRWYDDSAALLDYGFAELARVPRSHEGERLLSTNPGSAGRPVMLVGVLRCRHWRM